MIPSASGGSFFGRRAVLVSAFLTTGTISDRTCGCDAELHCPVYQKTVREFAGAAETLLTVAVEELRDTVAGIVRLFFGLTRGVKDNWIYSFLYKE